MDVRPINANLLKAGFEEDGHLSPYIEEYIDACPTLDYAPVVHAMWQTYRAGIYRCSYCDHGYRITKGGPNVMKFAFCPNCGAKMDGWKENV